MQYGNKWNQLLTHWLNAVPLFPEMGCDAALKVFNVKYMVLARSKKRIKAMDQPDHVTKFL